MTPEQRGWPPGPGADVPPASTGVRRGAEGGACLAAAWLNPQARLCLQWPRAQAHLHLCWSAHSGATCTAGCPLTSQLSDQDYGIPGLRSGTPAGARGSREEGGGGTRGRPSRDHILRRSISPEDKDTIEGARLCLA